jgi:hypothetical protein
MTDDELRAIEARKQRVFEAAMESDAAYEEALHDFRAAVFGDVPALIAEVRRLQAERFGLQAELAQAVILLGGKPCGYCGGPKNGVDHAPQCPVGRWERILVGIEAEEDTP